jgi:hypothetical protein
MVKFQDRLEKAKPLWNETPALPGAGEPTRTEQLKQCLTLAVGQGRAVLEGEEELRRAIKERLKRSNQTAAVLREAEKDYRALAKVARFDKTKEFYTSVADWFAVRASYYERGVTYRVPGEVDQTIAQVRELVDALSMFNEYLSKGGDAYFFNDPNDLEKKLNSFFASLAVVTTTLEDWTGEIRRQLKDAPQQGDVPPPAPVQ